MVVMRLANDIDRCGIFMPWRKRIVMMQLIQLETEMIENWRVYCKNSNHRVRETQEV